MSVASERRLRSISQGGGMASETHDVAPKDRDALHANLSLSLGLASAFCSLVTAVPALFLGIRLLVSGRPTGRRRALVGVAAATLLVIIQFASLVVTSRAEMKSQRAMAAERIELEAQSKRKAEEAARIAKGRALAESSAKIESARTALVAKDMDSVMRTVDWLRANTLEVPADLAAGAARARIAEARLAAGKKEWEEVRRLASAAKGGGEPTDTDAASLLAMADAAEEAARTPPPAERSFCQILEESRQRYSQAKQSGANQLKLSKIRGDRRKKFAQLGFRRAVAWHASVATLETNSQGKAVFRVVLPCGAKLKTWNNEFSDMADDTLIGQASEIFEVISELKGGQDIRVSGVFIGSDEDHFKESSLTENGSMLDPEFIFRFQSVELK